MTKKRSMPIARPSLPEVGPSTRDQYKALIDGIPAEVLRGELLELMIDSGVTPGSSGLAALTAHVKLPAATRPARRAAKQPKSHGHAAAPPVVAKSTPTWIEVRRKFSGRR